MVALEGDALSWFQCVKLAIEIDFGRIQDCLD